MSCSYSENGRFTFVIGQELSVPNQPATRAVFAYHRIFDAVQGLSGSNSVQFLGERFACGGLRHEDREVVLAQRVPGLVTRQLLRKWTEIKKPMIEAKNHDHARSSLHKRAER